jgi:hypothetical protein
MFAIMGVTGRVGGAAARTLLEQEKSVRAIVRDAEKAKTWMDRGAEIAVADYGDAVRLGRRLRMLKGLRYDPSLFRARERLSGSAGCGGCSASGPRGGEAAEGRLLILCRRSPNERSRVDHATPHPGAGTRRPANPERIVSMHFTRS